ncbi:MAG: recombinase family protein [Heliobacteriaceae bacterium]|nr:recombinase family protein [Heliobacteriaceae bacterium]
MFLHGNAPIGYIKKDGRLFEDPEQSDKVRMIFDKYVELQSVPKLQNYLRDNKIHTNTDKMFYKGHLNKLLRNKAYIGKIEHKDEVHEGLHDGIIDESVLRFWIITLLRSTILLAQNTLRFLPAEFLMTKVISCRLRTAIKTADATVIMSVRL